MSALPDPALWLVPDWALPAGVSARVTTRAGTLSPPPWDGFNLGLNCEDDPARVLLARTHVAEALSVRPAWLSQVHGTEVVDAAEVRQPVNADGCMAWQAGLACVVLTADCVPVLLSRKDGSAVAALHAGWRGLLDGILTEGVERLASSGEGVLAWIGPAICRRCYQVDDAVRAPFIARHPRLARCFVPDGDGHWQFDLPAAAAMVLTKLGVAVTQSGLCSHCDPRFYSFRHEGRTGRFASLIWLNKNDLS